MNAEGNENQREIKGRVLILRKDVGLPRGPISYLENRGWVFRATSDVRESIITAIGEKPDVFLISVDVNDSKIFAIPKILKQVVSLKIIYFAEKSTMHASNLLSQAGWPYLLHPPVSGPTFERMVLRMEKDIQAEIEKANQESDPSRAGMNSEGKSSGGVINIRGNKSSTDDTSITIQKALSSLFNDPGSATFSGTGAGESMSSGGSTYRNSNEDSANPGSHSGTPGGSAKSGSGEGLFGRSNSPGAGGENSPGQSNGTSSSSNSWGSSQNSQAHRPNEKSGEAKENDFNIHPNSANSFAKADQPFVHKERAGTVKEDDFSTKTSRIKIAAEGSAAQLMERATRHVLDKITVKDKSSLPKDSTWVKSQKTRLACISIECRSFSGYLIAAFSQDYEIDDSFLARVREGLKAYLDEAGEPVVDEDLFDLQFTEVEFEDWAKAQAQFLSKSIHKGNDIAFAFFPRGEQHSDVGASATVDMMTISIDELVEDVSGDFNLFIYLPQNARYIRYTKPGRSLLDVQKSRLKSRGIQEMHLSREEFQGLKKYRAVNFLNSKLQEFLKLVEEKKNLQTKKSS